MSNGAAGGKGSGVISGVTSEALSHGVDSLDILL
jgi:hypothetical protein